MTNIADPILDALRAAYPDLEWFSTSHTAFDPAHSLTKYCGQDGRGGVIEATVGKGMLRFYAKATIQPLADITYDCYESSRTTRAPGGDDLVAGVAGAMAAWQGVWESEEARRAHWIEVMSRRRHMLLAEVAELDEAIATYDT